MRTFLLVAELVSMACVLALWTRFDVSRFYKVLWTIMILVPVVGPLFYFAAFGSQHGSNRQGGVDDYLWRKEADVSNHFASNHHPSGGETSSDYGGSSYGGGGGSSDYSVGGDYSVGSDVSSGGGSSNDS